MSVFTEGFHAALIGDATLVALLSIFNGEPAVFTTRLVPPGAKLPYIVTTGEISNVPFDTKNTLGRTINRDIRCFTELTGSAVIVEQIAARVREIFHRKSIVFVGFATFITDVTGPIEIDEDDAYGRVVTVRTVMEET